MKALAAMLALALPSCATVPQSAPTPKVAGSDSIKGVHHVGITVSDIDDTIAFYGKAVPYELVERKRLPARSFPAEVLAKRSGDVEVALIRTPTVFLQLIDTDPARKEAPIRRPVVGPGYTHICFQTQEATPGYQRFKAIGLDMLSRGDGPVDLGGYGVTYAYGFDPDGIMIEMEQLSPAVIASQGVTGARRSQHPAWATHLANVPGDKPAMVAFYSKILGYGPRRELPPTRRKTFDDVVDIDNIEVSASWFDAGNFELEFWHYNQPTTPNRVTGRMFDEIGYNSLVFEVTDLSGTLARLEREGVTPIGKTFGLDGFRVRYVRDPEGNIVGFQQNMAAGVGRSIDAMLVTNGRTRSTPRT
jgi:catechol 2,3-dioxygenase-like lactoylglutathione lyase family enzyme